MTPKEYFDILKDVPTLGHDIEGVMCTHVDDCMMAGSDKFYAVVAQLEERVERKK